MSFKRKFQTYKERSESIIKIRVIPRSKSNEVSEIFDDGTIKIRITAPPVEGKANKELIRYLSKILKIKQSQIEIKAGHLGRDKLTRIYDIDPATIQKRIQRNLLEK